jgi:cob(I)alamin adenosyltransferase
LGSDLMAPGRGRAESAIPRLSGEAVDRLERAIDQYEAELPALRNFILPGGGRAGAHLHLARTICRRAERHVTTLARGEAVNQVLPAYLNRLSDLLFVLARFTNHADRAGDVIWSGPRQA